MRARRVKTTILIATIVITVIAFKLYGDTIIQWFMCTRWHSSNNSNITIGTAAFRLPLNWWVTEREEKKILLNRVTPLRNTFFGQIFIIIKDLNKGDLNRFQLERDLKGIGAVRIGDIETSIVDGETAYSVKYRIVTTGEKNNTIIWTLSVPSQSLVINVLFLHEEWEPIVSHELISKIRFVDTIRLGEHP